MVRKYMGVSAEQDVLNLSGDGEVRFFAVLKFFD